MNELPLDFYNKAFSRFGGRRFSVLRDLAGPFGSLSREYYENHAVYLMTIKNGQIWHANLLYHYTSLEQGRNIYAESSKMRNLGLCQVIIRDDSDSDDDSRIACKLPDFSITTQTDLFLASPTICKASEKLIDSIRIIGCLEIQVQLTRQAQGILERIVRNKTLGRINFSIDHQFDESGTKLVLDLLKKDKFGTALFSEGCNLPLKALIAEWRENSHLMIGKRLYFKANLVLLFGWEFQLCTDEDLRFLRKYHQTEIDTKIDIYLVLKGQSEHSRFWQHTIMTFMEHLFPGPLFKVDSEESKLFTLGGQYERAMFVRLSDDYVYKTRFLFV